jgi:hypothetical protein
MQCSHAAQSCGASKCRPLISTKAVATKPCTPSRSV